MIETSDISINSTGASLVAHHGHHPIGGQVEEAHSNFIYFWPIYTGTPIPIDDWRSRMWLDTWV
ncbi:hypothetical protein GOL98_03460 [Streptomyces sp. Z38]|nr:hypothetical protein [Streptomyces sp. Z38]